MYVEWAKYGGRGSKDCDGGDCEKKEKGLHPLRGDTVAELERTEISYDWGTRARGCYPRTVVVEPDATDTARPTVVRSGRLPAAATGVAGAECKLTGGCTLVWYGKRVRCRGSICRHAMGIATTTEMEVSREEQRKECIDDYEIERCGRERCSTCSVLRHAAKYL